MSRPEVSEEEKVVEVWELVGEGTVWVWQYDRREDKYVKARLGGSGGTRRLHITRADRRWNQEQVVEEMKDHDPFVNGLLRLISAERASDVDTTYHLTPEDLKALLALPEELFQQEVGDMRSELVLRRLREVAQHYGTVGQLTFLSELIEERYKVGGTQRTVREMMKAGEELSGTVLS